MVSDEKRQAEERQLEKAMYMVWVQSSGETNTAQLEHLKNCISVAINECLTEKQKRVLTLYMNGYSQIEIAQKLGRDRSTISRTLHKALRNLFDRIKYATPSTLHAKSKATRYLTRLYK